MERRKKVKGREGRKKELWVFSGYLWIEHLYNKEPIILNILT